MAAGVLAVGVRLFQVIMQQLKDALRLCRLPTSLRRLEKVLRSNFLLLWGIHRVDPVETAKGFVIVHLENFLAKVVMNAAHMNVPRMASMPAMNLNKPNGLYNAYPGVAAVAMLNHK